MAVRRVLCHNPHKDATVEFDSRPRRVERTLRLASHQPYFFPCIGYFALIVDEPRTGTWCAA
jgi:hypothetical protein